MYSSHFSSHDANRCRHGFALLFSAACICALAANTWGQDYRRPGTLKPRPQVAKPAHTVIDMERHDPSVIVVKFRDGLSIRAENGTLTDRGTRSLAGAAEALALTADAYWQRSHSLPEEQLEGLRQTAQTNSGREVADLNLQFNLYLPPDADPEATVDALNALDVVELAQPMPRAMPLPLPLPPDFQPEQVYEDPATDGIGAEILWPLGGGTGGNVAVCDIEYSWNAAHQDLPVVTLLGGAPEDPFSDDNHGTAVIGEVASINNGWGTSGIAYDCTMFFAGAKVGGTYDVGAAIITALGTLVPGDVILIEQQIAGPNYPGGDTQFGLVPVEWNEDYYNAIVLAVGVGVVVVEAAGNGSQNLDAPEYNAGHAPFLLANDSGAIIVGAGASPGSSEGDRSRLDFSNYGATVDLQGWGHNVTTTGYGGRYSAEGQNLWYTGGFSGTSSASPIVTGACALLQSVYFVETGSYLSPTAVRDFLVATGSPQLDGDFPATQHIGPRPNVPIALAAALENEPPVAVCQAFDPVVGADCCAIVTVADIDGGSFDPDGAQDITSICITEADGNPVDCLQSVELCGAGLHTVTLTITDRFGQTDSCAARVTLLDETAPTITCNATGGQVDGNCEFVVTFSATVLDNCCVDVDDVTVTVTNPTGNATLGVPSINKAQVGDRRVNVTGSVLVSDLTSCPATVQISTAAQDCSENVAVLCVATADVTDEIPPELTCPPDATFEQGNFLCDTELLDWLNSATATDNCDTDVDIVNDAPDCGFPPDSTNVVTWTATDDCGNIDQCSATVTILPAHRTETSKKGSLLVYPKVELRWDATGALIQDTFIDISNDYPQDVFVQFYFVNGDQPLAADPVTGERAHPGCNWVDNKIVLTADEPAYWSVATGSPKGVSPFTVLDPGDPPGRPDPEHPGQRVLRGFVIGWAVNAAGHEIRWNHLAGDALLVNYADASAWEYRPWAFTTRCVGQGEEPLDCTLFDPAGTCCEAEVIPGRLDFDGFQYDFAPSQLLLDFFASGATIADTGAGHSFVAETDLTLLPMFLDLRQDHEGPFYTKADFDIWNMNEVKFSGAEKCIWCWDQALLSNYPPPVHFLVGNLQTAKGKARIDGVSSTVCPDSIDAALLGVAAKVLDVNGATVTAGLELIAQGRESGRLQHDVLGGPEESQDRSGKKDVTATGGDLPRLLP